MRPRLFVTLALTLAAMARGQEPASRPDQARVTGIKAVHRHGQTFVTFTDAAEGEAGAKYRYSLYRSDQPITQENLARAELCYHGVLNNSAKQFGQAFNMKDRLDPTRPTSVIEEGGQPLPMWSGLAVRTADKDGVGFYAVAATDEKYQALSRIEPGQSATVEPVQEKVAPIQPIRIGDSKTRGQYAQILKITGTPNLPLNVSLHASSGQGGAASAHGDLYLYFGTPRMGWRDGLPGIFSVGERELSKGYRSLLLDSRDAIEHPSGARAMETYWFGYYCVPQWAKDQAARACPFTETRMLWIIDWVIRKYQADPNRVFAGGGSMGAWGSATFAFRFPEVFAAVYPDRPRTRQRGLPSLAPPLKKDETPLMDDGRTSYYDRMDMVRFAAERREDLPFICWGNGRRDGFATFKEQIDLVKALTAARHGFAFAWNDGDHSSGSAAIGRVRKYYGPEKFARNVSYPAFGNSSIDDDPGSGEVEEVVNGKTVRVIRDGALEGGINLGFAWTDVADEPDRWSAKLSNELAQADMTVDVTPRRCQRFRPKPGDKLKWTSSTGGEGQVAADRLGLVTVEKVRIKPGEPTTLTISR